MLKFWRDRDPEVAINVQRFFAYCAHEIEKVPENATVVQYELVSNMVHEMIVMFIVIFWKRSWNLLLIQYTVSVRWKLSLP